MELWHEDWIQAFCCCCGLCVDLWNRQRHGESPRPLFRLRGPIHCMRGVRYRLEYLYPELYAMLPSERLHYPVVGRGGDVWGPCDTLQPRHRPDKSLGPAGAFSFPERPWRAIMPGAKPRRRLCALMQAGICGGSGMHSSPTPALRLVMAQRVTRARPERPMRPIAVHEHADLAHRAAFFVDGRA